MLQTRHNSRRQSTGNTSVTSYPHEAMPLTIAASTETTLPWLRDPVGAHAAWRRTLTWKRDVETGSSAPPYTEHSTKLYQSFWGKYCRWLASKALRLDKVKPEHVESFLDSLHGRRGEPASVRTMRTYLAEIHRVYQHLVATRVVKANPAGVVLERKRSKAETRFETDPPLPFSPTFLAAYEKMAEVMFKEERAELRKGWTPARNLALRLLVADCGLKLSEVCKLVPRNVTLKDDGTIVIRAPGHRQVVARTVTGRPALAKAMQRWVDARSALRIVQLRSAPDDGARRSNRLFLGQADVLKGRDLVGGGLGAACSPIAPDLAERAVTSCVKRTLEQLGHQAPAFGPQLVRNAYGARLILEGKSDAEISALLGMKTTFTARALREKLVSNAPG